MLTTTRAGSASSSIGRVRGEGPAQGYHQSEDGTVKNDDATLSVDLVKDEELKKDFLGKNCR
jgi:hypothetical protein